MGSSTDRYRIPRLTPGAFMGSFGTAGVSTGKPDSLATLSGQSAAGAAMPYATDSRLAPRA